MWASFNTGCSFLLAPHREDRTLFNTAPRQRMVESQEVFLLLHLIALCYQEQNINLLGWESAAFLVWKLF